MPRQINKAPNPTILNLNEILVSCSMHQDMKLFQVVDFHMMWFQNNNGSKCEKCVKFRTHMNLSGNTAPDLINVET